MRLACDNMYVTVEEVVQFMLCRAVPCRAKNGLMMNVMLFASIGNVCMYVPVLEYHRYASTVAQKTK